MKRVLVLGANGQLGSCLKKTAQSYPSISFTFLSSSELDVTNELQLEEVFLLHDWHYCVNCAAYTQVDKAEVEKEKAFSVNYQGVKKLVGFCNSYSTSLIHISTDFVFDGALGVPYKETDETCPIGVYGRSKEQGEKAIISQLEKFFIIRTSWLYSEFGNNFVKTMLRLAKGQDSISVVNDQIGSPTYAMDLAKTIVKVISSKSDAYGLYHYSNRGQISWFDFASKVFEFKGISISLKPIKTTDFPSLAKRPKFSVLDTSKIQENIKVEINDWEESLKLALTKMYES